MAKSSIKDIDHGWKRIEANLRKMAKAEVTVGVQSDAGGEMARIASIHEFGSREWTITSKQAFFMARVLMKIDPDADSARFWGTYRALKGRTMRIPQRSFLGTTVDERQADILDAMRHVYDKILDGEIAVYPHLKRFGLYVQDFVTRRMQTGIAPPNAPLTRFVKQSDRTLVDTGHLVGSIRYKIRVR